MPTVNPYAPSQPQFEDRDECWYRSSVQKYYNRMGWGMIVYSAIAFAFDIYVSLSGKKLLTVEIIGPPILAIGIFSFFGMMVVTSGRLTTDFDRVYSRARWLGILAGAFTFPILTLPAYVAVRRLAICRKMRDEAFALNLRLHPSGD
jgi:hypothetical protein